MFAPVIGLGAYREELAQQPATPFVKAMQISERVGNFKWTGDQQRQVDAAIMHVARTKGLFTADDIWQHLGPTFTVTKGLAGRLNAAVRQKIIYNTGTISHAKRGGLHDHAQRLTVWAAYGVVNE
jgi:hypothetical protein